MLSASLIVTQWPENDYCWDDEDRLEFRLEEDGLCEELARV